MMPNAKWPVTRVTLVALSLLALSDVGPLANSHWQEGNVCPGIFFVPACYIVLVGYGLIFLSAVAKQHVRSRLFFIGWLPVFGLALMGVAMELVSGSVCPQTSQGIPKCFLSLLLSSLLVIVFLKWNKQTTAH